MREQHQKNRQQEQTKAKPVHQPAGKQSDRRKAPQGRAQNVRRRSDQQYPALPTMQGNSQKAEQQVNINRDIGSFHILLTMDLTPGSIFCHFFAKIEDCFENPIILLLSFVITFLLFVTTSLFYCLIIPRFGQSR